MSQEWGCLDTSSTQSCGTPAWPTPRSTTATPRCSTRRLTGPSTTRPRCWMWGEKCQLGNSSPTSAQFLPMSTNFQPKRSSGHQDSQRTPAGDLPAHQWDQGARHPLQGGVQPVVRERADKAGPGREGWHCGGDWGPWSVRAEDKTIWAKVATPTYIWERAHEDWNSPIEANYKPISPG